MNFTENDPDSYLSVTIAKSALFWLASVLACMTILTHLAQLFGITFKSYAYLSLFFMLAMSLSTWYFFHWHYRKVIRYDRGTVAFMAVVGLGGAFVSSFFHTGAAKISFDLFYYVPNAVYHLQNPDSAMDFAIHFLEAGSEPIISYFGATSLPFEYTSAVIAYFLNTEYLTAFFLVSPALFGFFFPIALFYLVCQFVNPRSAAYGALFAVAIVLLLGETPRTPGTWSLPFIFIGKIFFLSTGIPLFAAATLNFFRTSSPVDWVFIFGVATALVGTTSSSMVIIPVLTVVLFIACAAVSGANYKGFVKTSIAYSLSLSYFLIYTLTVFLNFHSDVSENSPVNEDFPVTFLGHAGFFFEKSGPATLLAFAGATVAALLMTSGRIRKFIFVWITATAVLFLNPIVAPFLIKYLTTPNIYWRLFYVYPLPLLLGLTGAKLYEYATRLSERVRLVAISGVIFILFIAHWVPFTTSVLFLRTEFGWPRYKMPATVERQAGKVIAIAPAGPMLAPMPHNGIITMLSANYPQMRVFTDAERVWFGERGLRSQIDDRICASDFVSGGKPSCLSAFRRVLEYGNLRSVVITKTLTADPDIQGMLEKNGFTHYAQVEELMVYWRK